MLWPGHLPSDHWALPALSPCNRSWLNYAPSQRTDSRKVKFREGAIILEALPVVSLTLISADHSVQEAQGVHDAPWWDLAWSAGRHPRDRPLTDLGTLPQDTVLPGMSCGQNSPAMPVWLKPGF